MSTVSDRGRKHEPTFLHILTSWSLILNTYSARMRDRRISAGTGAADAKTAPKLSARSWFF
jgi:hypothetical protein